MTTIEFTLKEQDHVELMVYDLLGRNVGQVVDDVLPAGKHSFQWMASHLPSGIYFCRLRTVEPTQLKRMLFVK